MSDSPLKATTARARRQRLKGNVAADVETVDAPAVDSVPEPIELISRSARTDLAKQKLGSTGLSLLSHAKVAIDEEKQAVDLESQRIENSPPPQYGGPVDPALLLSEEENRRRALQADDRVAAGNLERERALSLGKCCGCFVPLFERLSTAPCVGDLAAAISSRILREFHRNQALRELREGVILPSRQQTVDSAAVETLFSSHRLSRDAIFAVHLSHCEELLPNPNISHPLVRISIIDLRTGYYWKKSSPDRIAITRSEQNTGQPVDYYLPILSQPYKLQKKKTFTPKWNEDIPINDEFSTILSPFVLIFFEILDFGPKINLKQYPDGFFPIAWGFLKPIGTTGKPNYGNLRLQLYHYNQQRELPENMNKTNVPMVYYHWLWQKHGGKVKYPGTIFVNLYGREPLKREKVIGARPLLPTQIEEGRLPVNQLFNEALGRPVDRGTSAGAPGAADLRRPLAPSRFELSRKARTRAPLAACEIPNIELHSINVAPLGCFCMKFSPDGRILAAACAEKLQFVIKLYDVDTGRLLFIYNGHYQLIYDLQFDRENEFLLSASSDCTAKMWFIDLSGPASPYAALVSPEPFVTLQHPAYVYCAQFHPLEKDRKVIITGAYDGIIRFWDAELRIILWEIQEHSNMINSLLFIPSGKKFFTADSNGIIKIWEDRKFTEKSSASVTISIGEEEKTGGGGGNSSSTSSSGPMESWKDRIQLYHTISHEKLIGNIINTIDYHPNPERLLIITRDNCIYIMNLIRYDIRKLLTGHQIQNSRIRGGFSPDGQYSIVGSEDGCGYLHSISTGQLMEKFDFHYQQPCYEVLWHPNQHLIAFSFYGDDLPIKLYEYRKENDKKRMAQQILDGHGKNNPGE